MKRRWPWLMAITMAALAGAWVNAEGVGAGLPEPADAERGQLLFKLHCQGCHGAGGRGDGPIAEHLRDTPSDLTVLAREEGGAFPAERVERIIDGRDEVPIHGTREMPVWGLSFREPGLDRYQERDIMARIRDLVKYVGSIQID